MTEENHHAVDLVIVVQEMIDGTLAIMKDDPFHCPADWLLENWWNTLDIVRREITSALCEAPSAETESLSES